MNIKSLLLTLSMCGCVWWAMGWAALQAVVVSSLFPKPDCPPSGRGRRAAEESGGRWVAAGRLPVKRHLGLTSLLVTGYRLAFLGFFFFFSLFWISSDSAKGRRGRRVTPPAWQECVWGWWDIQSYRWRSGATVSWRGVRKDGRERKRFLLQIKYYFRFKCCNIIPGWIHFSVLSFHYKSIICLVSTSKVDVLK